MFLFYQFTISCYIEILIILRWFQELKDVFSKVLLSNLISRTKKLPLLKTSTEEALLKSLIKKPGETHLLLELVCCEHEAFKDITKSLKDLYLAALEHCLNSVTVCGE